MEELIKENVTTCFLGSVGTYTTFVLETINPWLSLFCGVLTAVYLLQAIWKKYKG